MPQVAKRKARPIGATRAAKGKADEKNFDKFKESLEQAKETVESEEAAAAEAAAAAAAEPQQMTPEKLAQMEMPGAGRKNRAHEGFVKMLTELYDSDKDGRLSWPEFQTADKMRPSPTRTSRSARRRAAASAASTSSSPTACSSRSTRTATATSTGRSCPTTPGCSTAT